MNDLLIHTSNVRVDVLVPNKLPGHGRYDLPCICFSLNQFISHFGEYIYLFKKDTLEKNFKVDRIPSKGIGMYSQIHVKREPIEYNYRSIDLEWEFRVYNSIDVQLYGLGVITNFNHMKGVLEKRMSDKVIREAIDFSREDN